jgi:hypothetical protein
LPLEINYSQLLFKFTFLSRWIEITCLIKLKSEEGVLQTFA